APAPHLRVNPRPPVCVRKPPPYPAGGAPPFPRTDEVAGVGDAGVLTQANFLGWNEDLARRHEEREVLHMGVDNSLFAPSRELAVEEQRRDPISCEFRRAA